MRELVLVSGGFDPIHSGHIYLIQEASKYGEIVVLLNSDEWLKRKKGKEFMPFKERAIIMKSLKYVIDASLESNIHETWVSTEDDKIKEVSLNYGAKEEIVNACKKLVVRKNREISVNSFGKELYTKNIPAPEILIRTGGT